MGLVRTLYPEERQLGMTDRLLDESVGPALKKDPNIAQMETDYPGIVEAMLAEARPLLRAYTTRVLPKYHGRMAALVASRMTSPEILDLTEFYRSPTGRKLVNAVNENIRLDASLAEIISNPDAPTSLEAVTKDHQAAAAKALKSVDSSDVNPLRELGRKPYFEKVRALGPAMRKLDQELMNEPDPEFDKVLEDAFKRALDRHMAAADKKSGAK